MAWVNGEHTRLLNLFLWKHKLLLLTELVLVVEQMVVQWCLCNLHAIILRICCSLCLCMILYTIVFHFVFVFSFCGCFFFVCPSFGTSLQSFLLRWSWKLSWFCFCFIQQWYISSGQQKSCLKSLLFKSYDLLVQVKRLAWS